MSKSIHATIKWDEKQALKAAELVYKHDMRHSPKRYTGWLFIALMQFGIVAALKYNSFTLLVVSAFLVFYWYVLRWWLRKRLIEKFYKKKDIRPTTLHLYCNEEGISIQKQQIKWSDVAYAFETDTAILIQTNEELLYIPLDSFDSLDDVDACYELLKKHACLH